MRIPLLSLLLATGISPIATAAELGDRISITLEEQGLVGAVWATVDPAGVATVGAAGRKDARRAHALESTARVQVASLAKPVLSTGILLLVSQGRVSLDDPVASVLPDVAFDNPWEATDPVRLRHLLDQTSGLDDARLWQVFSLHATPDTSLSEVFTRDPDVLKVRSRPGTRFSYSNMGYTLAGRVIEAVTGERYESFLDNKLLAPLGMHDSTFGFVTQEGPGADTRLAMGHFEDGVVQAAVPTYVRPAGQFTTTATDMARFARFLMSDGRVQGQAWVNPALLRAMGQAPETEAALAGLRPGYGLGLYTRDRNGVVGKCHGGSTVGYRAMLCIFPDSQGAYFYSINTDSESGDRDALDVLLLEALDMPAPDPLASGIESMDVRPWTGYYVPSPNRFATFAWIDTLFNFVRVEASDSGLQIDKFRAERLRLDPVGSRLFRAPGRRLASHALLLSADGEQVMTTGTQSYAKTSLANLLFQWTSLVLGLLGAAWLWVTGVPRLLAGRLRSRAPAFAPTLGVLALVLPVPLLLGQSFLALGDLTVASGLLAAVTLVLPLTMLVGLWQHLQHRPRDRLARVDGVAMLAVLQWALVLAAWGLLPLRLWV